MKKIASAVASTASLLRSFSALRKALFILPAFAVALTGSARAQITSTWTAATDSTWAGANWNNGVPGATSLTINGDTAIFTSAGTGAVTVDTYRNIKNITFNGSTGYTLSSGALYLTAGGEIQNTSASTASQTINTPITLEGNYTFDSSAPTADTLNFGGNITQAVTGSLTLQGSNTGTSTISGNLTNGAGNLSLTKTGLGTWILTGANTYSGATTVSGGTLQVGNGTSGTFGSGSIVVNVGGTLAYDLANGASVNLTTTDNGTIVGAEGANISNTIANAISGTGVFLQTGTGTTVLSNNSSFSGGSTISAGTVNLTNGGGLGTGTITLAGGTLEGNNADVGNIVFAQAGTTSTLAGTGSSNFIIGTSSAGSTVGLSGSGNITDSPLGYTAGAYSLILEANDSGFTGTFTINSQASNTLNFRFRSGDSGSANAVWIFDNGSGFPAVTEGNSQFTSILQFGSFSGNGNIQAEGAGANTIQAGNLGYNDNWSGEFSSGGAAQSFIKVGTGTQTFSYAGTQAYQGNTIVQNGTLLISGGQLNSNAAGYGISTTSGSVANAVGTLAFDEKTGDTQANNIADGGVVMGAETTGTINTLSGIISGTGTFIQNGAGTTILSGANTYSGSTTVNTGTLTAGIASVANTSGAFGLNSAVVMSSTSAATLNLANFNTQIGSLTGGSGSNGNVTLGTGTLTVGGVITTPVNYAGIISGTGAFVMNGTGTQTLSGANTYTGTTTISGGTLQLGAGSNTGALATGSTIVDNGNFAIDRSDAVSQGTQFSGSAITGSGSFTQMGTGTTTLATNSYTGGTYITAGTFAAPGGTLYANGGTSGSSSATGGGAVNVGGYSTLAGSGVIRPTINGAGVVLAAHSNLISGVVQTAGGSHTVATKGLTLDSSGETSGSVGKLLDATSGSANLTFYLGYGVTAGTGYANPNTNSSYLTATGTSASASGELAFATGDTITVNDLTSGNLNISLTNPYLLIQAGTTPLLASDDALYSGILTSGMANIGSPEANGWVENLTLAGTAATDTTAARLYLYNGDLEIVPEPGTWALMLGGLGLLFVLQRRRNKA